MLSQHIDISQNISITPQMQQSLHILQMHSYALRDAIMDRFLSNPFLEVSDCSANQYFRYEGDSSIFSAPNHSDNNQASNKAFDYYKKSDFDNAPTLKEYLLEQLGLLSDVDTNTILVCKYFIECLHSNGYLYDPIDELAEELGITISHAAKALGLLQSLEPAGVGAKDLSECLCLQLQRLSNVPDSLFKIAGTSLDLVAQGNAELLAAKYEMSVSEVEHDIQLLRSLNPIPSRGFSSEYDTIYIIPDVFITSSEGNVFFHTNNDIIPKISISEEYLSYIGRADAESAQEYLKRQLADARNFIFDIERREKTLCLLIETIIYLQKDYFINNGSVNYMTMQDAADIMNVNVSTVSRTIKDKHIQFNNKIIPIKHFFAAGIHNEDGVVIPCGNIKKMIADIIAGENRQSPLSDEAISDALAESRISVARRTVAKYRTEMGIAPCRKRKIQV